MTTTTTELKLHEKTVEMEEILRKGIKEAKIDPQTGQAVLAKEVNDALLAVDGLTAEDVKKVSTHRGRVLAALGKAGGEESTAFAVKHKSLDDISIVVPSVGKDSYEMNFQRSRPTLNPRTKEAGTKYGALTLKYHEFATGNHGEISRVKAHISEHASTKLSD